jgi:acetyl esterase
MFTPSHQRRNRVLVATALVICSVAIASSPKPNAQMKTVLDDLQAKGGKPIETLRADEARKQPSAADATHDVLMEEKGSAMPEAVAKVQNIQIDGAAGKIPARIYTPSGKAPMPVILYFHGGGFVIATNDTYDATPRALANQTGAIVISPEYRKGPEFKFPAAHDDANAAYQWALANAASLGGDTTKIAVAGESAGGNLALNVAIFARDHQIQQPISEVLIYPVAGNDMTTSSYKENKDAKPLNKAMMAWFFKNYVPEESKNDPRLNLVKADLHGLKPATVITAEIDPLRSEGKDLANRLTKQGVKTDYRNYEGVTHEFFGMASVLDQAKKAQKVASDDLKRSFHKN